MPSKAYTDRGNRVRNLLQEARELGLTRREIAAELQVNERTLRRWVAGSRDIRTEAHRKLTALLSRRRP